MKSSAVKAAMELDELRGTRLQGSIRGRDNAQHIGDQVRNRNTFFHFSRGSLHSKPCIISASLLTFCIIMTVMLSTVLKCGVYHDCGQTSR